MIGALVEIFGLESARQYNGAHGRIVNVGDRLEVRLDQTPPKTIKVRRENVQVRLESASVEPAEEPDIDVESANVDVKSSCLGSTATSITAPSPLQRPIGSQFFCAPTDLHFCHDTISCKFRSGVELRQTLNQLLAGEIRKRDV